MPLDEPFIRTALGEVLLLAVLAGALGTWIVLRRLAFYTHAVGTATFPGLVLAEAWQLNAQALALVSGLGFAGGVRGASTRGRAGGEAATGLVLVAALALGTVLASDVYESGSGIDRLLFGTLIGLTSTDLLLTAAVVVLGLTANAALRRTWLAGGFDERSAQALGVPTAWGDRLLLLLVAAAVVVSLSAVGALLVIAVLVVPAATMRLVSDRLRVLQWGTGALAAVEGIAAVWLAYAFDLGPGAVLAVLSGLVFGAVAIALRGR